MTEEENDYQRHARTAFSSEVLSRKKKKQSPANQLSDDIIKYIKSIDGSARRISYGVRVLESGQRVSTGMKRGIEDVTACIPVKLKTRFGAIFTIGVNVGIEIKIGSDKMSEHQVKRMNELTKAGGYYLLATDIDNVKLQINAIIRRITECFQSP